MVEEFQEADVLWPDLDDDDQQEEEVKGGGEVIRTSREDDVRKEQRRKYPCADDYTAGARKASTKPVGVPLPSHLGRSYASYFLLGGRDVGDDYIVSCGGGGGGGRMASTPPHIVTSRRMREKVAFSMCSGGRGRTLKGRDLRRVRNAVLRMTGFLES